MTIEVEHPDHVQIVQAHVAPDEWVTRLAGLAPTGSTNLSMRRARALHGLD